MARLRGGGHRLWLWLPVALAAAAIRGDELQANGCGGAAVMDDAPQPPEGSPQLNPLGGANLRRRRRGLHRDCGFTGDDAATAASAQPAGPLAARVMRTMSTRAPLVQNMSIPDHPGRTALVPSKELPLASLIAKDATPEQTQEALYKQLADRDLQNGMPSGPEQNPPKKETPEEEHAMNIIIGDPRFKTICQLGFNSGVSTLRWLLDTPAKVYVFDAGKQNWGPPAADFLSNVFPGRVDVAFGEPVSQLLKTFQQEHPNEKCNFVNIDVSPGGGDVTTEDIKGFVEIRDPDYSLLRNGNMYCGGKFCLVRGAWYELFAAAAAPAPAQ